MRLLCKKCRNHRAVSQTEEEETEDEKWTHDVCDARSIIQFVIFPWSLFLFCPSFLLSTLVNVSASCFSFGICIELIITKSQKYIILEKAKDKRGEQLFIWLPQHFPTWSQFLFCPSQACQTFSGLTLNCLPVTVAQKTAFTWLKLEKKKNTRSEARGININSLPQWK